MPPLQQLHLRGCVRVSGAFALAATVGVAALRVLCMPGLPLVTDASLQAIAAGCPQLHTIDISSCTQVRGAVGWGGATLACIDAVPRRHFRDTSAGHPHGVLSLR
jgi:hypothetical protein